MRVLSRVSVGAALAAELKCIAARPFLMLGMFVIHVFLGQLFKEFRLNF